MNSERVLSTIRVVIKKQLYKYFEQKLETIKIEISIEDGCKQGVNFIGIVHRVTGTPIWSQNDIRNRKTIFLKIAPTNVTRRERFHVRESFLREIFVYSEVGMQTGVLKIHK